MTCDMTQLSVECVHLGQDAESLPRLERHNDVSHRLKALRVFL